MGVVTFGETMVLFVPEGTGPLRFAERFSRTVGVGDAFAAGFLSGQLHRLALAESVEFAYGMGAYALTVPGDVEGLPDMEALKGGQYAR